MRRALLPLLAAFSLACGDKEGDDSAAPVEEVLPGDIAVSPAYLELGALTLGGEARGSFTITNEGAGDLHLYDVAFADDAQRAHYTLLGALSGSLAPGEALGLEVVLRPQDLGDRGTNLELLSDDPDEGRVSFPLRATVSGLPAVRLDPPSVLDLGAGAVGLARTGDIFIANDGTADLHIESVELIDPSGGAFSLVVDPSGSTLRPDAEDGLIRVGFTAPAAGAYSAQVVLHSNDPDEADLTLAITASGV